MTRLDDQNVSMYYLVITCLLFICLCIREKIQQNFHAAENPCQCSGCGNASLQHPVLTRQVLLHIGDLVLVKVCPILVKYYMFNICMCCAFIFHVLFMVIYVKSFKCYNRQSLNTVQIPFQCSECDFKLLCCNILYMRYKDSHTDEKPSECNQCNNVIGHTINIAEFIMQFNLQSAEKLYPNTKCDKYFNVNVLNKIEELTTLT